MRITINNVKKRVYFVDIKHFWAYFADNMHLMLFFVHFVDADKIDYIEKI